MNDEAAIRFQTIFNALPVATLLVDHTGTIRYANQRCTDLTAYQPQELENQTINLLMPKESQQRHNQHFKRYLNNMQERKMASGFNIYVVARSRQQVPVEIFLSPLRFANNNFIACFISDRTEIKEATDKIRASNQHLQKLTEQRAEMVRKLRISEQNLEKLAHYDNVTNLPNRTSLEKEVQRVLHHAASQNSLCALLFVDVDNFKQINDTFGHQCGDRILKHLATFIRSNVRDTDFIARFGGDELVILMEDIEKPYQAAQLAQRLIEEYSDKAVTEQDNQSCSLSIGIATYPHVATDVSSLIRCADKAMYTAKQAGKGTYAFYKSPDRSLSDEASNLENHLRSAVANEEFSLLYQPLINLTSGRIAGMEVFLRWHSPEFGEILPENFMPVAEQAGLTNAIGFWTLETACQQLQCWLKQKPANIKPTCLTLGINISLYQLFTEAFTEKLQACLARYAIPPECIQLELAENALMRNLEEVGTAVNALNKLGVRIATDGFGTGYLSLNALKYLPLRLVKIDHSFISRLSDHARDRTIIQAMIDMGKALELELCAQGVETPQQLELLKQAGCHYAQGRVFAPLLSADEATAFIHNHSATNTGNKDL